MSERFISMVCLKCIADPEHIREHEGYGEPWPWIPSPEDLEWDESLVSRIPDIVTQFQHHNVH